MRYTVKTDEVAHLWAHQRQGHAKNNGSGNHSFDGDRIYSYSTVIGRRINHGLFVLSDKHYSCTTSGHQSLVRSAIPSTAVVLTTSTSSGVLRLEEDHMREEYAEAIKEYSGKRERARADWIKASHLSVMVKNATMLQRLVEHSQALFGRKAYKETVKMAKLYKPIIEGGEVDMKRIGVAAVKMEKKKQKEELQRKRDQIQLWRTGGGWCPRLDYALLRVVHQDAFIGGQAMRPMVRTSLGSTVTLDEAVSLYHALRVCPGKIRGRTVGGFTVISVTDELITIGCHRIQMSEVHSVLEPEYAAWLADMGAERMEKLSSTLAGEPNPHFNDSSVN